METAETISNTIEVVKPNVILSLGVGYGTDSENHQLIRRCYGRKTAFSL